MQSFSPAILMVKYTLAHIPLHISLCWNSISSLKCRYSMDHFVCIQLIIVYVYLFTVFVRIHNILLSFTFHRHFHTLTHTHTRAQWKCFMHFNITMKFSYTVNVFVPTINTHKNPIKMEMNQNQWKCHKVFDVAWNVGSHFSLVANRIIFIAFNFHIKGNQIRTYSSYLLMH